MYWRVNPCLVLIFYIVHVFFTVFTFNHNVQVLCIPINSLNLKLPILSFYTVLSERNIHLLYLQMYKYPFFSKQVSKMAIHIKLVFFSFKLIKQYLD